MDAAANAIIDDMHKKGMRKLLQSDKLQKSKRKKDTCPIRKCKMCIY